jgi:hypothetical protein
MDDRIAGQDRPESVNFFDIGTCLRVADFQRQPSNLALGSRPNHQIAHSNYFAHAGHGRSV